MNIAVLGLGIIGSAWARNLIADGHAVRCWNPTPRDFANCQDAVEEGEAIFVVVADPPAVQSVLDQIAPGLDRARSSSNPARSRPAGRWVRGPGATNRGTKPPGDYALAHGLVRLGLGVNIALHGTRVPHLSGFSSGLREQFAQSILPPSLVYASGYGIAVGEAVIGSPRTSPLGRERHLLAATAFQIAQTSLEDRLMS
jgi:hypothetical protein